jgi:hypothetical protein
MKETVLLKITTRKGSRIESVPLMKLQRLAKNQQRFWKLDGDFIVIESY